MGETQSFLAKGSIQSFKSGKSAVFFSWGGSWRWWSEGGSVKKTALTTFETLSTSLTYAESIWATLIHTEVSWRQGGRLTEGKGSRFLLTFTKSVEERSNESDVSLLTRSDKQPPHGGQEEQQTRWQVDWGQRDRSSLKGRVRPPTNRDTPATNSTWDEYKYARAQKKSTNSNTNMKTNFLFDLDGGFQSSRTVSPRCHRWYHCHVSPKKREN